MLSHDPDIDQSNIDELLDWCATHPESFWENNKQPLDIEGKTFCEHIAEGFD